MDVTDIKVRYARSPSDMVTRARALAKLYEWRNRAYFRERAWEDRGLIRSPDPVPQALDSAKNCLVDDLLKAVFSGCDDDRLIKIMLLHLAKYLDGRLDTEEREFLADCVSEIATSLGLTNFETRSQNWMIEKSGDSHK